MSKKKAKSKQSKPLPKVQSGHSLTKSELRSSLYLPIGIAVGIWVIGLAVATITPADFNTAVSVAIGISLIIFLIYWTRKTPNWRWRVLALAFALPAMGGITNSLVSGRSIPIVVGVGVTILLLILLRFITTPFSYRVAYSRFQQGDIDQAYDLINKSIEARNDFWESFQLRALIHLINMRFQNAEQDVLRGLALNGKAHSLYNTLGQVYLAQKKFRKAAEAYTQAILLAPNTAVYRYYLGLAQFRLGDFQAAAEALSSATQRTLQLIEHDLQTHYYLGRSLVKIKQKDLAKEAFDKLPNFKDGLPLLKEQLENQPSYPHLPQLKEDVADIEKRLATA